MLSHSAKIGFISSSPLNDKRAYSGTIYTMAKSLETIGAEVIWIPSNASALWYRIYLKIITVVGHLFPCFKKWLPRHPKWRSGIINRHLDYDLLDKCDVIFAPMQSYSLLYLKTDKPIVYLSDATSRLLIGYYWFNVPNKDIEELELIESTAIQKATSLIYPCHWAAESAVRDYGQPQDTITLAFFGPNINKDDISPHVFSFDGHLDILFVGVDWQRKGGEIAVEACRWLNDNGIESTLHIVGIRSLDESVASLPFVIYHGFLDKNNPTELVFLTDLYNKADCFLLPTVAECTGISFCEASAFGLPCYTHNTGGVSDYVIDGESGRLLPLGSTGADFGRIIKEDVENGRMKRFSEGAIVVGSDRLSWTVWAEKVGSVIERIV